MLASLLQLTEKESFAEVHALEESLETVIKHHLPRFSGDINAIKVACELKHIINHCTTAYRERLGPPSAPFPTVLEAGVVPGKECQEVWKEPFDSSFEAGMGVISTSADSGTALRGYEDRARKVCIWHYRRPSMLAMTALAMKPTMVTPTDVIRELMSIAQL